MKRRSFLAALMAAGATLTFAVRTGFSKEPQPAPNIILHPKEEVIGVVAGNYETFKNLLRTIGRRELSNVFYINSHVPCGYTLDRLIFTCGWGDVPAHIRNGARPCLKVHGRVEYIGCSTRCPNTSGGTKGPGVR